MSKTAKRVGVITMGCSKNLVDSEVLMRRLEDVGYSVVVEPSEDDLGPDDIVVLHDDVLATGGTMAAAYKLVKSLNPKKIYINFIIELSALNGRAALPADAEVTSLIVY